jgi:RNA recognition motif-containing protein
MDNITKLKCRKCNGNHLTIKCNNKNKDLQYVNTNIQTNNKYNELPSVNHNTRINYNTPIYNKYYKVKMSELPNDITENELYELLQEWGTIIKIIVKHYEKSTTAYITFKNENEVDYLLKALNSTIFDHNLIFVDKII